MAFLQVQIIYSYCNKQKQSNFQINQIIWPLLITGIIMI